MPAMPATGLVPPDGGPAGDAAAGLVVRPFQGLRYDPARVSDLARVTSPPYDVIDPDSAADLERLDPHNVVRLILPREDTGRGGSRYAQARAALDEWIAQGVLRRDPEPALYVYEQSGPEISQRGVIAAVGLHDPAERVILPHENVMPGPVADRLELMRATAANLEPILLTYDGAGATAEWIDRVCEGPPLLATTTEDGVAQRLWAETDPVAQAVVADDLAPRQALIADGHHRYATYRRLQAEHRNAGAGPGDWDLGLAMLVDGRSHPLHVQAIHRVVSDLSLAEGMERARSVFRVQDAGEDLVTALAALEASVHTHPYVVTDGIGFALLDGPDPRAVELALPSDENTSAWRSLDASVLHALLLGRLWAVDDLSQRIGYLHDAAGAVRAALRHRGVAVLMRPVTTDLVHRLAARGERMPRKSTSFGPKPRTGVVLRLLGR